MLTYAIGDVHGCAWLLSRLLEAIEAHRADRPRRLVFLGDYVDRGPDSAGVVVRLRELQAREPEDVVCLAGNHEDMMVGAGRDRTAWWHWMWNGGKETLDSYGVGDIDDVPAEDRAWLAALPTLHEDGRRIYVHAGLRPGLAPRASARKDRLWIREDFLNADYDFGKHVVHGHTPQRSGTPDLRPLRTNLDTAAVFGGALTAGVFTQERAGPVAYIRATPDGRVSGVEC